jgi:hypothetical protein
VLAVELIRAPAIAVAVSAVFAVVWIVRRRQHAPVRRSARRMRREVVSNGLITATVWLTVALARTTWEIGSDPMQPAAERSRPVSSLWPWAFLLNGLATTTGATYVTLAIGTRSSGPGGRRRGGRATRELAPVKAVRRPSP